MKVAIAGYGVEGESSYRYFSGLGHEVTIVDQAPAPTKPIPEGAQTILGPSAFDQLEDFELVVRTPPLDPRKIKTNGVVTSATKEFFAQCPAQIIAITGTKGKGTTSSFIAEILKAAGKRVHTVGNIGVPALDKLPEIAPDDVVVFEISSFQLWDLEVSPYIAVVLLIEPDHLDVHPSFDDYVHAKGNIARYQKPEDIVVFNPQNEHSIAIADLSPGIKLGYGQPPAAHVKDGYFWMGEQQLCSTSTVVLPGKHNLDNAAAAITAAWQFTQDVAAITTGLNNFKGLPHRLKYVKSVGEVMYYDDSIATTPGSAIAAINSFVNPKVLILGGSDKGSDYSQLIQTISDSDSMRAVICVGSLGPKFESLLQAETGVPTKVVDPAGGMKAIVDAASELAESGDVVILSPSCASFDMFKSYSDRGDQFVSAVESLDAK